MTQTSLNTWTSYPMGPNLRSFLGIQEDAYLGEHAPRPTEEATIAFRDFLEHEITRHSIANPAVYVDLLEELTAMGLSSVTVKLAELNAELPIDGAQSLARRTGRAALTPSW